MYTNNADSEREYFECFRHKDYNKSIHLHRCYELIYVVEGNLIVEINCVAEEIQAGEYALIFSNTLHSFHTTGHSDAFFCLFSGDLVRPFVNFIKGKAAQTTKFRCRESVNDFANRELFIKEGKIEWYMRKALLYAIVGEYRKNTKLLPCKNVNKEVAIKVFQYLEEHYTENVTLFAIAETMGYEKHYISKCLHKWTNMNFTKILNWYRVDAATELLQNSNYSIAYIAMESGFQSIRNFNRVFLQLTGRTPLEAANSVPKRKNENHYN